MLAKRNIGTNAIEIRNRITASVVNAAVGEDPHLHQRVVGVQLDPDERSRCAARPIRMQPMVAVLVQPHWLACWSPSTSEPMPTAARTAPLTSSGAGRLVLSGLDMRVRTTAAMATGMLIQKIARQDHSMR